jgi:hypothetical protein
MVGARDGAEQRSLTARTIPRKTVRSELLAWNGDESVHSRLYTIPRFELDSTPGSII